MKFVTIITVESKELANLARSITLQSQVVASSASSNQANDILYSLRWGVEYGVSLLLEWIYCEGTTKLKASHRGKQTVK
jgi:hypothetical protein